MNTIFTGVYYKKMTIGRARFLLQLTQFLLVYFPFSLLDKTMTKEEINHFKYDGFFKFLAMANLNPLFQLGSSRALQQVDLGLLPEKDRCDMVINRFREARCNGSKRSLFDALLYTVGWKAPAIGLILQLISAGCGFGPPMILDALVKHFTGQLIFPDDQLSPILLWILVCLLFAIPVLGVLTGAHSVIIFTNISATVRNAIVPEIFKKSLVIGNSAKQKFSSGMILNLYGNDIANIQLFLQNFAEPLFAPLQLAVALALIYQQMGVAMFAGMAVIVGILPCMTILVLLLVRYRTLKLTEGDARVKLTNEVLSGIRILKYYAWESAYEKKIDAIREIEIKNLARMNYVMPWFIVLIMGVPVVMPIVMFYTYVRLGNQLDAAKAFTTLSLFGLILVPVYLIPQFIQQLLGAQISMNRIESFLEAEENENYVQKNGPLLENNVSIRVRAANFSWQRKTFGENVVEPSVESVLVSTPSDHVVSREIVSNTPPINRSENTLMGVDFSIKQGQLVAIVGSVGSGKSSLLSSLLGDLHIFECEDKISISPSSSRDTLLGEIKKEDLPGKRAAVAVSGTIAYHAQVPWILNATVMDNILFGRPYIKERFDAAVDASSLGPDIAILPQGLNTEIGERGINLSGGQKARISFARVVYRDADVCLLDDPLSAVGLSLLSLL